MKSVPTVLPPLFSRHPSVLKPCRQEGTQPHPPHTHTTTTETTGQEDSTHCLLTSSPGSSDSDPTVFLHRHPHTDMYSFFFLFWQTSILNCLFSVHNFVRLNSPSTCFHFWFLSRIQLSFQRQCHLGPAGVALHWE